MFGSRHRTWDGLETAAPAVFLLAGGAAAIAVILTVLDSLSGGASQGGLLPFVEGIAGFGGLVLSFVALVGLYPRLVDRAPRLARVGLALLVIPVLLFVVDVAWLGLSGMLGLLSLTAFLPSTAVLIGTAFLLFAFGCASFGIVPFISPVLTRRLGGLLLVVAGTWYVLVVGSSVYGFPLPMWLDVGYTGVQAVALLSIGYLLRVDPGPTGAASPQ